MFLRCLLNCSRFGINLRPYVVMIVSSWGSGSPLKFHIRKFCHFCIVILWFSNVQGRLGNQCSSSDVGRSDGCSSDSWLDSFGSWLDSFAELGDSGSDSVCELSWSLSFSDSDSD